MIISHLQSSLLTIKGLVYHFLISLESLFHGEPGNLMLSLEIAGSQKSHRTSKKNFIPRDLLLSNLNNRNFQHPSNEIKIALFISRDSGQSYGCFKKEVLQANSLIYIQSNLTKTVHLFVWL